MSRLGRWGLIATGAGMVAAGLVILSVGTTRVFVAEDLDFMGLTRATLDQVNPRLIPLIAHDRAGFGGGLASAGILVTICTWYGSPSRAFYQAMLLAGAAGFGCAIGVHCVEGYTNLVHLAPALAGAGLFASSLALESVGIRRKGVPAPAATLRRRVFMRGSLVVSLAACLGCHAIQPAPTREALPVIDGFVLNEALASAVPRLLSCNPPVDTPAPATRLGRWCYASDSLLLIFSGYDSLVQMQLTTLVYSDDTLHNAESVWRARTALFRDIMRRAPDSVVVKPIAPLSVHRWPDSRGSHAQVLRACWLGRPDQAWHGNVWLYDEMRGPDTARTRGIVEVFAGAALRPGCFIGSRKEL